MLEAFSTEQLNKIPFPNSWTAGQVGDHLLKSYGSWEIFKGWTCVDATGVFKANYMNKILERWHREGISTSEQAQAETKQRREARKEANQPSFDLEAYERDSLFDTIGGNH